MSNERSIWSNIKRMVNALTDTVVTTTEAANSLANTINEVAKTTEVMASANREVVTLDSELEKAQKIQEIKDKYGVDLSE